MKGYSGKWLVLIGACLLLSITVTGCFKVGADYEQPNLTEFTGTEWKVCAPLLQNDNVAVRWWTQFDDAELNRLVQALLRQNISLKIARERIVESRAQRGVTRADLLPRAYLGGYGLRTRAADDAKGLLGVPGGNQTNLFAAAALAGWELDLWGRVQRLVEAADNTIETNRAAYGDTAVSLVAELALSYVDARALESRIRLTERKMALQEQRVALTESRFHAGTGTLQELLLAQAAVSESRAQQHTFFQAKIFAENSIATLLGVPPSKFAFNQGCQLQVPMVAGLTVPASLLSRRPDIRKAEQEYAASVALIGAAKAERFPKIALGGVLSFQTSDVEKLFHADTLVYAFGGGVLLPVFTGGRIDAQIAVQESISEQRKYQLQQTVVEAVAEVENSAVGVAQRNKQVQELSCALQQVVKTVELTEQLFRGGLVGKDSVIQSDLEQLDINDALVVARQQELGEVIHLYRALGGGWDIADSSVAQLSGKAQTTTAKERVNE